MPMQEFLASYAVKVDEDGVRRLQSALEQNRTAAKDLSASFTSAREALSALKKELSDATGLSGSGSLSGLLSGLSSALPKISLSSLRGGAGSGAGSSGGAGSSLLSGASARLSVTADTTPAAEAISTFRTEAEGTKPKLSVNTTGIISAVASAIAAVRTMLSGLTVTIPVRAVASLDASGLRSQASAAGMTVGGYASGGRVSSPTLAMIAEEGSPEYVIPVKDESRALPLLRSLLSEMSASARAQLFFSPGSAGPAVSSSVQAPVNISVTSSAASPEAVARSVYDTAQRSLLTTLKGVFD